MCRSILLDDIDSGLLFLTGEDESPKRLSKCSSFSSSRSSLRKNNRRGSCVGTRKNIRVHTSRLYCVSERRTVTRKKGRKNKANIEWGVSRNSLNPPLKKKQNKKQHTAVMVRSFGTSEDATKDYKWSK